MIDDQQNYDKLDVDTLTNLLINPENGPNVHRRALSALCRASPNERRMRLIMIMRNLVRVPQRYDQDVMMSIIEILATDPEPEATRAMIEVLPEVLAQGLSNQDALKPEFRQYFYEALVTRQRDDDLEVWAEMIPQFNARSLVGMLLDPVGGALDAVEPLTLIDRQVEPERTKALISLVAGLIQVNRRMDVLQEAVRHLKRSSDPTQLEHGLDALSQRWERASKQKLARQASMLEKVLSVLDTRPRSSAEKLMGKRPWAS